MKFSKVWRNWFVHNTISHPLSEIAYWLLGAGKLAGSVSGWIHDVTIPDHKEGEVRG